MDQGSGGSRNGTTARCVCKHQPLFGLGPVHRFDTRTVGPLEAPIECTSTAIEPTLPDRRTSRN